MPLNRFPDPSRATPEGIVAFGGQLDADNLLHAYRQGIFPWPVEDLPLAWFCPPERAVLDFADLRVPRSLAKTRRQSALRFTVDARFAEVITACAKTQRPDQNGTWITARMIRAYCELHEKGHAHSVEAWDGEELAGGLYGVDADGVFAGESMFYRRPNASKLALLYLIDHLAEKGAAWMDIQAMTPHMAALGAKNIPRATFLRRLAATRALGLRLF